MHIGYICGIWLAIQNFFQPTDDVGSGNVEDLPALMNDRTRGQ